MAERPDPTTTSGAELIERLWRSCRRRGLDRRSFLQIMLASGAASTACGVGSDSQQQQGADGAAAATPPLFKDTSRFVLHGNHNLEARLEQMGGFITPNELFFVRDNSRSIEVDAETYRLQVKGDAVSTPLVLSHEEILRLPSRSVFSTIECGGNHRAFFDLVKGQTASGTQWKTGAIGMAVWTGVPLCEVLMLAGVREQAVDVQLIGLDTESPEQGFRRSMPIDKAMDTDTILAYSMNGAPLPPDHGYPLRAVVPGWVGSTSIKWIGHIDVSSKKIWSRNNTSSYVLIGDAYPPEGEAAGKVATLQSIKSALALPWPARLSSGRQMIRGYAQSPHAPIARVEWSEDEGRQWQEARLLEPVLRYSWARFEFEWQAAPGLQTVMTRATDAAGNSQPDELPFNEKGYLFNLPLPHPVTVS